MSDYCVVGSSGGIGRAVSTLLLKKGHRVFGLDVKSPEAVAGGKDRFVSISADITRMESLSAALKQILSVTDGLDGIVHAAGVFKAGSLVEVSEADITGIFNINTFGVYRVNRVFLPLLRNRKGRIIILSSETGRFSACFNGLYSMTKYALEAYSDALRRELALLGIRVIILQPGAVRTDMVRGNREAFLKAAADSRLFGDLLRGVADFVVAEERRAMAPEVLARSVEKLLRIRHPRPRYRIGNNRGRALLERLPASLADAILHWVLKRSFCK